MSEYYIYRHRPGHGSTDHLAPEVISRAARILGLAGAQEAVNRHAGFAPKTAGEAATVRLPKGRGVLERMRNALSEARDEMPCKVSLCIEVELRRERRSVDHIKGNDSRYVTEIVERWADGKWHELSSKRKLQNLREDGSWQV